MERLTQTSVDALAKQLRCDGCGTADPTADFSVHCSDCLSEHGYLAVEEYKDSETPAADLVREWVDRAKALGRLTPSILAAFEDCLEDIR